MPIALKLLSGTSAQTSLSDEQEWGDVMDFTELVLLPALLRDAWPGGTRRSPQEQAQAFDAFDWTVRQL